MGHVEGFLDGVDSGDLRADQRMTTCLFTFTEDPSLVTLLKPRP